VCLLFDPQVVRFSRDIPLLPLPEAAKRATQQVSRLIATRQQQQQLLRQQQQQSPEAAAAAAAADALQQDAGTDISGPKAQQLGLTRIYTPAPPKGAEASEADRQPLQFMSLRQQQQLREEARRAAVLKVGWAAAVVVSLGGGGCRCCLAGGGCKGMGGQGGHVCN
jgi:type II secretory pathway pseudopilin PulG